MEIAAEFQFVNFLLNSISYQPLRNIKKFFLSKIVQVIAYAAGVYFFQIHQSQILYDEDDFGNMADYYKFIVSALISLIIILEPFFRCKNYFAMVVLHENLEKSLKNIRHQQNISLTYKRIKRELKSLIVCFMFFYAAYEFVYFARSLIFTKSRLFYFSFLVPTFIINVKTIQLVLNMKLIAGYLDIVCHLIVDLNEEILDNQKLKSRSYDKIIRNKYRQLIAMHDNIVKLVDNYNQSLGISQFAIMLAIKFFLAGDFYWIAFSSLQKKMKVHTVYGKIN